MLNGTISQVCTALSAHSGVWVMCIRVAWLHFTECKLLADGLSGSTRHTTQSKGAL